MASQPAEPRTLSEAPAPDPTPGRQAAPISEASSLPPEPAPITPAGPDETPMSPPLGQWFAPSSGAPAIEQPDTPLKLWSGWEVGWIAFWLGFPGGLALAARNWFRMGRRPWAAGHLIAGGVGFALFVVLPDSAVRGLALLLNIGLAFYLYRQTESDIASLEATDRPIETASWVSGIATSLAATALLVGVVAVPFAFSFIADTAPATTLSAFFGESFDRLPADQREQLERRFEAAVGDSLKGLPATDAAARVNARAAGGMPRFDDATLVERLRLLTVAVEATPTTTCAAFGRAALTGTPNPDAVSTMLGSLDTASFGRWMEIYVEGIEADGKGTPPTRSASQTALDTMWNAFGGRYSAADDAVLSAEQGGSPQPDTEVCAAYRHIFQAALALGPTNLATFALYVVTP